MLVLIFSHPQVTREYKIERHRVPKAIASRRKWAKFGDAEQDTPEGPDPATTLISDDVFLTLTSNKEVCHVIDSLVVSVTFIIMNLYEVKNNR